MRLQNGRAGVHNARVPAMLRYDVAQVYFEIRDKLRRLTQNVSVIVPLFRIPVLATKD